MSAIAHVLRQIVHGPEPGGICPDPEEFGRAISEVMEGAALPTEIAGLLVGMRCRGERAEHLDAAVRAMLSKCAALPLAQRPTRLFDTCGTGGDGHGTVNISTAAALLASAAGIPVCKHGNRSVSSSSGSADVLEALGLKIDCSPEVSARMLAEKNFCFLFAPLYHPAMRHAGPVRRELRLRTIFNLCGPLSNPAAPTHQLLGVSERGLIEPMAETLRLLGRRRALVVHGANGLDEVSLTQMTMGLHLREDGKLESWTLEPRELGVEMLEMADLVADGPVESAAKLLAVLDGSDGPVADEVCANLAAVFWLDGQDGDMRSAFNHAREVQRSGIGAAHLQELVALSHSAGGGA